MLIASYTNEGNALESARHEHGVRRSVPAPHVLRSTVKGYGVAQIHGRHLLDQFAP